MRFLVLMCVVGAVGALAPSPVRADAELASVFGNHMVLQRDRRVAVWGWAEPAEKVTVRFAGQSAETEAGRFARWQLHLEPMEASNEGRTLTIQAKNTLTLKDVLVGDNWLCSGQSNMEWATGNVMQAKREVTAADYERIRLFNVRGHLTSPLRRERVPGRWAVCSPQTVRGFSAVGYFFGRRLHEETGVAIGLIGSNWGGTRIEPWTPPEGFRRVPQLKRIARKIDRADPRAEAGRGRWEAYLDEIEGWVPRAREALEAGVVLPEQPDAPGFGDRRQPTAIYNAMIHPLVPFDLQGAIWYQGEANGGEGMSYFFKMRALIEGWREVFGNDELEFYYVQLANWRQPTEDPAGGGGWSRIREAQRAALRIPRTGMAVTIDIGNADDIHPRNKQDVGARLARWALRDVYGQEIVVSGPLYKSHEVEGDRIRVHFGHVGSGLMVARKEGLEPPTPLPDAAPQHFAIAGTQGNWHWAEAQIDGETVVVWSEEVEEPTAVRYAYAMNPAEANLYNREGLPAAPFSAGGK
jgi:sialate O-acetylesterase